MALEQQNKDKPEFDGIPNNLKMYEQRQIMTFD